MVIILSIIFYLIGVILAFGKMTAIDYELLETYKDEVPIESFEVLPWYRDIENLICVLALSWISFLLMIMMSNERKYSLKFNYKGL